MSNKWTDEVIEFIAKKREEGLTYPKINRLVQTQYGIKTTNQNLYNRFKQITAKESENMNWKTEPATRKQCKYIAGLSLSEGNKKQRKNLEDALYVKCVNGSLTKESASLQIEQLEKITKLQVSTTKKPTSKKSKTRTSSNWTKEEEDTILQSNYQFKGDFHLIKELLPSRTASSTYQRYLKLRKERYMRVEGEFVAKPKTVKIDSALEDLIEKHGNPITRHLSKDDVTLLKSVDKRMKTLDDSTNEAYDLNEMEVLLAFYEKSIDELREQFNAPFWAIAKVLENIHDLKEPHHSDLLMEAARVTKERKDEEYRVANMSRRERRKIARKARKTNRLQARLDKLRGVANE